MPQFEVRWSDAGRIHRRRVDAPDAQAVAAAAGLRAQQVLGVERVADARSVRAGGRADRFPLRLFSKELAVLLGAGIPLLEAVATLREKESSVSIAGVLHGVEQHLRAGDAFSTALRAQPRAFDELYTAVVSSAERTGQLREALDAHSRYLAWVEALRDRLIGASIYPLVLVFAGSAVVMFLLVYVVPRFAGLLDGMGGDIPAGSRALLFVGAWTGAHPQLALTLAAMLLTAPWLAWTQPGVRDRLLAAMWSVPGTAGRLRTVALARLYRTLSMLLTAGVPISQALRTANGVAAAPLRAALEAATARIDRGERLSDAMLHEGLTTPVALRMLRVGERSGSVGPMLGDAASFYDEELARLTEVVTRLINPLLMLLMGSLIGGVVVLMYLPIFQLMDAVQ
ncbi:MAG: type II secretion system F family protein [Burkholderiales bacterium]|nr:type II secretion system F family protein [Burkholderiales bacterium]